jgi:glycosyltransferase involved in cell wall biosynthesis
MSISIVIPAKNEALTLAQLLPRIKSIYGDAEIIVVDDGSTDDTKQICEKNSVIHLHNQLSKGNGAAIKRGARAASGNVIVFMDGDGQHEPYEIKRLLEKLADGVDMVVGSRDARGQASSLRQIGNFFYNRLSSFMVGQRVKDLTSGFRAVDAEKFREFLHILPNKFSYPTTITMAFFRSGYQVDYVDVQVKMREGKSHLRPLRDGARFFIIIFKIATLYSPLKVFAPISFLFFALGLIRYAYTYTVMGQFTNMSALLMATGIQLFMIGLVSEQITSLTYQLKKVD